MDPEEGEIALRQNNRMRISSRQLLGCNPTPGLICLVASLLSHTTIPAEDGMQMLVRLSVRASYEKLESMLSFEQKPAGSSVFAGWCR